MGEGGEKERKEKRKKREGGAKAPLEGSLLHSFFCSFAFLFFSVFSVLVKTPQV